MSCLADGQPLPAKACKTLMADCLRGRRGLSWEASEAQRVVGGGQCAGKASPAPGVGNDSGNRPAGGTPHSTAPPRTTHWVLRALPLLNSCYG